MEEIILCCLALNFLLSGIESETERSISQCQHPGWGISNCEHSEDVGVICDAPPTTISTTTGGQGSGTTTTGGQGSDEVTIRLVNNVDETEGRGTIEIEFNGVKGSVCDDDCIEGTFLLEIFRHGSLFTVHCLCLHRYTLIYPQVYVSVRYVHRHSKYN
ncbi:scavenger receptor cysteine-rich domain-containing group B protein-like [Crassostrea virginica]